MPAISARLLTSATRRDFPPYPILDPKTIEAIITGKPYDVSHALGGHCQISLSMFPIGGRIARFAVTHRSN
jgi:hypothetical protein